MQTETYPTEKVREQFPSLSRKYHNRDVAYFDGPGGSQVAGSVIEASVNYMKNGVANLHGLYPTSYETEDVVDKAREAASNLLGAEENEMAFGANMSTLAFAAARALERHWRGEDGEIVVTELDHHANIDPWTTAAENAGFAIRRLKVDSATLSLDLCNLNDVINEKTKLVAVGLASNAVGTINDVRAIVKRAKEVGALVAVDAVHAVPHFSVDFKALDVDFLFCSAYKFFGPHVGIAAIKKAVFEQLQTYRLQPAPSDVPEKLETGTQNYEGLAGLIASVRFFAELGDGKTLREQILEGYKRIETYENQLADRLRIGLGNVKGVTLYQAVEQTPKTPTIAFRVKDADPQEVCRHLAEEHAVFIASGDFYATTLAEKLGVGHGGFIRAGLAPYNTEEEVDRLIKAVESL